MNKLCAAMAKAFPDIEGATKDKKNDHFKSRYADLSNVVEAIKPALAKHGLFFVQKTHDVQGGVCVETEVWHASGEHMSFGPLYVPVSKNDAQGFGSALTYCRRYSLMTAFGVAPEDDDGNAAAAAAPRQNLHDTPCGKPKSGTTPSKPLSGLYKTRAEVKAAYNEVVREMHAAADMDTLDAYLITQKPFFDQLRDELPNLWNGDGMDFIGMSGEVEAVRRSILMDEMGREAA